MAPSTCRSTRNRGAAAQLTSPRSFITCNCFAAARSCNKRSRDSMCFTREWPARDARARAAAAFVHNITYGFSALMSWMIRLLWSHSVAQRIMA